nr:diguanylate cyclase [Gallaecimonas mangrovi]
MQERLPGFVGRPRLLVVDDQPINIRALNEIFKDEYECLFATSGEQALIQARTQKPDLILLDVMMPDISGHQVCQTLKKDPTTADIPIIFVTSQNEDMDEAYGFELGAVDFISKPINPVIVRARVKSQVALKLQYDFMRNMALLDGLTGVPNRRRFDEELKKYWLMCRREHKPLTVVLIDVDFFKRYNDCYGHLAGDDCLRQTSKALQSALKRPLDLLCRYGGEEFACLLPYTDAQGAQKVGDTLQQVIAALGLAHSQSDVSDKVTVSIGIATQIPTAEATALLLVEAADGALYQSKSQGRAQNQLVEL